jgi:hypothetical protein
LKYIKLSVLHMLITAQATLKDAAAHMPASNAGALQDDDDTDAESAAANAKLAALDGDNATLRRELEALRRAAAAVAPAATSVAAAAVPVLKEAAAAIVAPVSVPAAVAAPAVEPAVAAAVTPSAQWQLVFEATSSRPKVALQQRAGYGNVATICADIAEALDAEEARVALRAKGGAGGVRGVLLPAQMAADAVREIYEAGELELEVSTILLSLTYFSADPSYRTSLRSLNVYLKS